MASISSTMPIDPVIPVPSDPKQVVVVTPDGKRTSYKKHHCWPWLVAGVVLGIIFMLVWNSKESK